MISAVVTRGFGSWGSANLVVTRGFSIGSPVVIATGQLLFTAAGLWQNGGIVAAAWQNGGSAAALWQDGAITAGVEDAN